MLILKDTKIKFAYIFIKHNMWCALTLRQHFCKPNRRIRGENMRLVFEIKEHLFAL